MSIKQDYILKIIEQVIDLLLERTCGLRKREEVINSFSNYENSIDKLDILKNLIDDKKVNEAENKLFEYIDEQNSDNLKLALLFYDYLNLKPDKFLEESDFSREEIREGILDISKMYGYDNLINIYFSKE